MKKYVSHVWIFNALFIFIALLFVCPLKAQSVFEELSRVTAAYLNTEYFSASVRATYYLDKYDTQGKLLGSGVIHKTSNSYYSKFMNDEFMTNDKCSIEVDLEEKTVNYYKKSNEDTIDKPLILPDMELLENSFDSVTCPGYKNGLKIFSLFNSESFIYRTDVFVDTGSMFVSELVYYYIEPDENESYEMYKMIIEYSDINTKKPDNNIFSEKNYVRNKNGEKVLASIFRGYTLIIN